LGDYGAVSREDLKLVWWHVGRFFHSFAILESSANELFEKLFNLNATFFLLLVPQLDFGRRLELIRLALRRRAVNVKELKGLFDTIRDLIEVRNIVAHSGFGPDDDGARNNGVIFDYVGRTGRVEFSERVQMLVADKPKDGFTSDDAEPKDSFISYNAFEDLDGRMKQLTSRLWELAGACIPLSDEDFDDETVQSMRDVLNRNVIPLKPNEES
jgi:hypothetical protein